MAHHALITFLSGNPEKTDTGLTGQELKSRVLNTLKGLKETTDKEPQEIERRPIK